MKVYLVKVYFKIDKTDVIKQIVSKYVHLKQIKKHQPNGAEISFLKLIQIMIWNINESDKINLAENYIKSSLLTTEL